MSKYYKAEDVIRKYAEMIADEAYWEHGVGNGSPDEEDMDIAREYYSDLPTIDIVHCKNCKWAHPNTLGDYDCKCHIPIFRVPADGWCYLAERK